ncbi:MAG: hypothetical protein KY475_01080 [Planctomycetes bacterium]|nr:hypothetical protein [Planctomycetota bacterium]
MIRKAVVGFCAGLVLTCATAPVAAGGPRVRFDTDAVVACADVTPVEFAEANPGEKLIEARFLISTLIAPGDSDGQLQHLYTIESRQRTMQVHDYLPKTTLAADVVGHMLVEKKDEKAKTLGLTVTGAYEKMITGTGSAGIDSKSGVILKYEKLPALELLAASGPIRRGTGVYFKLKPSSQTSLEGAQEFAAVFRVPATWRGDYVYVHCEAWSVPTGFTSAFGEPARVGGGDFFVALHLEGDVQAKAAAQEFARAEHQLRSAAARCGEGGQRRTLSSVAQFAAWITPEPKAPVDWLARLMYRAPAVDHEPLLSQLPPEARTAAEAYLAARWSLAEMSQWGDPASVDHSLRE